MPGTQSRGAAKRSDAKTLAIACVATVVIIAVLAGLYFFVLKQHEATAPEQTVLKYFEALSTGDTTTLKSLFTPEAAPDQASLDILSKYLATVAVKYEDIKLKTLEKSATDATVQLLDLTAKVKSGDQVASQKMSSLMSTAKLVVHLKYVNGAWLFDQKSELPGNLTTPGTGGSTY